MFLSAGSGFQACRAHLFPLAQQLVLDELGRRVDVADFSLVTSNVRMMPVVWTALVAVDLLNMLRFHTLAEERERGAADALFAAYSGRAGAPPGAAPARRRPGRQHRRGRAFLRRDRGAAGAAPRAPSWTCRACPVPELRDVYLCGDIYLRVDEWGNDALQRKLADNGLRVLFEPFGEFFELLQLRQIQDGVPLHRRPEKEAILWTMGTIIGRLLRVVLRDHPWVTGAGRS